ncbi:MAG: glycerophosphodiester phosphodiesterase, partial [Alistipes sp.]|nr:glycerophosphodiester phosphodiesterase [Alistipes sp.]
QEACAVCKDRILINIDKGYAIFDESFALSEQCGVTRQLIMKGGYGAAKVAADFAPYKDKVIYMPIVNMDQAGAADSIQRFQSLLHPVAYELLFGSDSSTMPAWVAQTLQGESLIWYNVMWNHMAGERYDDMALTEPDRVYGYLVDSLGARLLQTDRPQLLIEYLKAKGRH